MLNELKNLLLPGGVGLGWRGFKNHRMLQGSKIFYGWWVVLAAGVGLFMSVAPIFAFTFGVFFKPLSQEFGWSRTEISLAFSLNTLVASAVLPLIGRLVDRFDARKVIVPSILIFGLGLISFYFLSASLWHFYTLYLVMGIVGTGTMPVPYSKVISHWFDKKRGLALGLALAGVGLGTFIMPSLAQALIAKVGWRQAYALLGLMVMGVTIPVVGLFLKETPQIMGLLPDGETVVYTRAAKQGGQKQGLNCREAWHTGTFWLMVGAFFLMAASINGCVIHLVPMLTDRGLSAQSAAFAASLFGGALLVGRVGTGYLLDCFFAPYVAACFFCGPTLGLFLLWSGAAGGLAFIAAILVGLGLGAEVDIIAYLVSRYFGLHAFGEIYGYAFAIFVLGAGIGPLLMGGSFDATGSYSLVLGGFVVATLTASGLMTQLGPYPVWQSEQPA